jgi:predicted nucleotidyltransferase
VWWGFARRGHTHHLPLNRMMNIDISVIIERRQALEQELERIIGILVERYQPEKLILFGSLVSGEVRQWSDINLLVIKETEKRPLDRALEVYSLLADYKEPIDIIVYTPAEVDLLVNEGSSFVAEILTKGKLLYETLMARGPQPSHENRLSF